MNKKQKLLVLELKEQHEKHHIAYILGNGINRYAYPESKIKRFHISWDYLLDYLKPSNLYSFEKCKDGISPTEYYDIMCLHSNVKNSQMKQVVLSKMINQIDRWPTMKFHKKLAKWFINANVPVLTTNFDRLLSKKMIRCKEQCNLKFNYTYPMVVYYRSPTNKTSLKKIHTMNSSSVCNQFGIWHINGMIDYAKSIRFGLTDYVNQSAYIKKNFLGSNYNINDPKWNGYKTWLEILYKNNLCIVGLSLDINETFLRWLLIRRAIYYKRIGVAIPKGWYIYCKYDNLNSGKEAFLKEMGFDLYKFSNYDEIYNTLFGIKMKKRRYHLRK